MKILATFFTLFFYVTITAQDTLVFSQKKSSLFSNEYYLFTKSHTFEHKFTTDDGQIWYGKGNYKIKNHKIVFKFGDTEREILIPNRITRIYNYSQKNDTLNIKIVDVNYSEYIGSVKYKENYFWAGNENGTIKILKTEFENEKNPVIEFNLHGSIIKIKLDDLKYLKLIEIKAKDINDHYHFESNFERTLKYKKNKMISNDYYSTTKNRKVVFGLINKR